MSAAAPLTPEERALVDLHHRIASYASDDDYDATVLHGIAQEMRRIREAATVEEALEVIAWWRCDRPEDFVRRARRATLRMRPLRQARARRRAERRGPAGGAHGLTVRQVRTIHKHATGTGFRWKGEKLAAADGSV